MDVAVNVSQRQLWRPGVARQMIETIAEAGAEPGRVVLEVGEANGPRGGEVPQRALMELREAGIRIAIDDFAHSPLSSLQQMEVDTLKIDPSVIRAGNTPEGELMVRAIIQLAHNLGIWAIAEGVETRAQFQMLRRAGCRYGQGFYFSEPVEADALVGVVSTT
jgi:EAL domain-containing protein (putative c-di-GMP-specific phosphodiesterase class I)